VVRRAGRPHPAARLRRQRHLRRRGLLVGPRGVAALSRPAKPVRPSGRGTRRQTSPGGAPNG
jgi:hypothetical protein